MVLRIGLLRDNRNDNDRVDRKTLVTTQQKRKSTCQAICISHLFFIIAHFNMNELHITNEAMTFKWPKVFEPRSTHQYRSHIVI